MSPSPVNNCEDERALLRQKVERLIEQSRASSEYAADLAQQLDDALEIVVRQRDLAKRQTKRDADSQDEIHRLRKRVCAHHLHDDSTFDIDGCFVCRKALAESPQEEKQ